MNVATQIRRLSNLLPARSLWQSLSVLSGGQVLIVLLSLLFGKLVAKNVSPTETGAYNIVLAGTTFISTLLIAPLIQSFKTELTQTAPQVAMRFYGLIAGKVYATALIVAILVSYYQQWTIAPLLIWGAAMGQGLYTVGNELLVINGKYKRFSISQVLYYLLNLGLLAIVVLWQNLNTANGLWLVLAGTNLTWTGVLIIQVRNLKPLSQTLPITAPSELWKRLVAYSKPVLVLSVWGGIVQYADRFILSFLTTAEQIGQYTVGYSLGAKLVLLVAPFISILTGQIYQAKANGSNTNQIIAIQNRVVKVYVGIGMVACVLFWSFHQYIGQLLLSEQYKTAYLVAPLIAIGYLLFTVVQLMDLKFYAFGEVRYIVWHTIVGAVCGSGCSLLFIPMFGIMGAPLAVCLGYLAQLLCVVYLDNKKRH